MGQQELEILQKVILVVLQLAIPPLLAWGIAEARRWIELQRKRDDWWKVEAAVRNAVEAAEQLGLTKQIANYGEAKLETAIEFIEAQLDAAGVPLDIDQYSDAIRAMIEAEVKRLKQQE
jgi:biopolymer transport protein ExbB/TolQ